MPTADYHFVDRWRVAAGIKEVADVIEDALSLPRWELLRRRAKSPEELARLPSPPRPSLVVRLLSLDK
jgi:hypothetical protein